MKIRRISMVALCAVVALVAQVLSGCRAFQPEAVQVNRAPETYIIGAPPERAGGYYRFHVHWYGKDVDGRVERFVWALTDTTVQNPRTTDDEEDARFNPALDATTLAIGHWTTRTDSVFNFTIDAGVNRSANKTLHMVAIDDFGAYDRTPARLHFFTNSLGNPDLKFFRVTGLDTVAIALGVADTVGFGRPYEVTWRGRSPNVRGYSPEALALVDNVPPFDDGLFGYKWKIDGALGGNCQPSIEDCWHPRKFNETTGDSFSFFGKATSLAFTNDGSGTGTFRKQLPSGTVSLEVNSIDVAGVEVADFQRRFSFVVNYDPETLILDGIADWAHPEDPQVYPYYIRLNDPTQTRYPFRSGDRIPDRTYVVVKALARDDERDGILNPNYKIGFSGFLQGVRQNFTGGVFPFLSESSEINVNPTWGAGINRWYGDTLGFLTAPSSRFTINMRSVDEHERRDGSPASLSFDVGFEPCVQCIELLPKPSSSTSNFNSGVPCVATLADVPTHPCLSGVTDLRVSENGFGPNDLQYSRPTRIMVNKGTGFVTVKDVPTSEDLALNYSLPSRLYKMAVLLHGMDDPREAWTGAGSAVRRIGGWQYEISYNCDEFNEIKDGGGNDDIRVPSWGQPVSGTALVVDVVTGLWKLEVDVAVPTGLIADGPEEWRLILESTIAGGNPAVVDMIFNAVTRQFGLGWVDAVALDQTACGVNPVRPAVFNFFRNVRPPAGLLPGSTWRDCSLTGTFGARIKDALPLSQGVMSSLGGQPVRKYFRLTLGTGAGDFICTTP